MEFKILALDNLSEAMTIINQAKKLLSTESGQWQNGYPSIDTIKEDIAKNQLFGAFQDTELIGIEALIIEKEPNYININGKWLTSPSDNDLVIHRVAVKENQHGKKLGLFLLRKGIEFGRNNSCESVKIDTHISNVSMRRIIQEAGFIYCGEIRILRDEKDNLRNAYELVL